MKALIKLLSEYGKFNYEAIVSSIPKQDEEFSHVIYYGTLMKINENTAA